MDNIELANDVLEQGIRIGDAIGDFDIRADDDKNAAAMEKLRDLGLQGVYRGYAAVKDKAREYLEDYAPQLQDGVFIELPDIERQEQKVEEKDNEMIDVAQPGAVVARPRMEADGDEVEGRVARKHLELYKAEGRGKREQGNVQGDADESYMSELLKFFVMLVGGVTALLLAAKGCRK